MARKAPTPRQAPAPKSKRLTRKQFEKLDDAEVRAIAQHLNVDSNLARDDIASAIFGTRKQITITPIAIPSPPPPSPIPGPSTSESQPAQSTPALVSTPSPAEMLQAVLAEQEALEAQLATAKADIEAYTQRRVALYKACGQEENARNALLLELGKLNLPVAREIARRGGLEILTDDNGERVVQPGAMFKGQPPEPGYAQLYGPSHDPPPRPRLDENGLEVDAWRFDGQKFTAADKDYCVSKPPRLVPATWTPEASTSRSAVSTGSKRARFAGDSDDDDDSEKEAEDEEAEAPKQKRRRSSPHPSKDPALIKGKGRAFTPDPPSSPSAPVTPVPVYKGKSKGKAKAPAPPSPDPFTVEKVARAPSVQQAQAPSSASTKRARSVAVGHTDEDEEAEGPATRAKRTRLAPTSKTTRTPATAGPSGSQSGAGPSGAHSGAGPSGSQIVAGPSSSSQPTAGPSNSQAVAERSAQPGEAFNLAAFWRFGGGRPPNNFFEPDSEMRIHHTGNTPPIRPLAELLGSDTESSLGIDNAVPAPAFLAEPSVAPVESSVAPVEESSIPPAEIAAAQPQPAPETPPSPSPRRRNFLVRQPVVYFDPPQSPTAENDQAPVASTSNVQTSATAADLTPAGDGASASGLSGSTVEVEAELDNGNDDAHSVTSSDQGSEAPPPPTPEEERERARELASRETLDDLVIGNRRRLEVIEFQRNGLREQERQIQETEAALRRRRDKLVMAERRFDIASVNGDNPGLAEVDDVLSAIREQDERNVSIVQADLADENNGRTRAETIWGDLEPFSLNVREDAANRAWWTALRHWRMYRLEDRRRRLRAAEAADAGNVEGAKYVQPTQAEVLQLVDDKAEAVEERYLRAQERRALRLVHKRTGLLATLDQLDNVWPHDYWPPSEPGEDWFMDDDFSDAGEEEREVEAVMEEGEMDWDIQDWVHYDENRDYQPVFMDSEIWADS
ncbi:hypothetical protein OF83DRAFT_1085433 [Amylostereum chailletii]|nr:hypothetical protein OF83DRAFT_1085433 [Amylostereum chailletii]